MRRRSRGSAPRGALTGAVAGVGAWTAHALSGGEVAASAGAAAVVASVLLGRLLAADGDPRRIAALALGAQSLWHLVFTASSTGSGHGDHAATGGLVMLAAHGLVAAGSAALAVGLDRALVTATARLAATLLPRLTVQVRHAVVVRTPSPLSHEPVGPRPTPPFLVVRALRGPPELLPSATR